MAYNSAFKGSEVDRAVDKALDDGFYYFREGGRATPVVDQWRANGSGNYVRIQRYTGSAWNTHYEFNDTDGFYSDVAGFRFEREGTAIWRGRFELEQGSGDWRIRWSKNDYSNMKAIGVDIDEADGLYLSGSGDLDTATNLRITGTHGIDVRDSTEATSDTTGAITAVGGISSQDHIYAGEGFFCPAKFKGSQIGDWFSNGTLPPIGGSPSTWELSIGLYNTSSNTRRAGQRISIYNKGDNAGFGAIGSHVYVAAVAGSSTAAGKANVGYSADVRAISNATASSDVYGAYVRAVGAANGGSTAYGVYAEASGADNNFAGYFVGRLHATGAISAAYQGTGSANANLLIERQSSVWGFGGASGNDLSIYLDTTEIVRFDESDTNIEFRSPWEIEIQNTQQATSDSTGALRVSGGGAFKKNVYISGLLGSTRIKYLPNIDISTGNHVAVVHTSVYEVTTGHATNQFRAWDAPTQGDHFTVRNSTGSDLIVADFAGTPLELSPLADGENVTYRYNGTDWRAF